MSTDILTNSMHSVRKTGRGFAAAVLLGAVLSGCSTAADHVSAVFSASPGKYDVYSCNDLEAMTKSFRARRTDLEQLMARSSQSAGGGFINFIAYRTEYEQAATNLEELSRARADKQCSVGSKYSSGRAVF